MTAHERRTPCILGVDFGTDSVRTVVIDATNGKELASAVALYPRWAKGLYCDPAKNRFRQHPARLRRGPRRRPCGALAKRGKNGAATGWPASASTPPAPRRARSTAPGRRSPSRRASRTIPTRCSCCGRTTPRWPRRSSINRVARTWGGTDFTKYEGGVYSSEWFWSKILHVLRSSREGPEGRLLVGRALRLDARPAHRHRRSARDEAQPVRGRAQGDVARGVGGPAARGVPREGRRPAPRPARPPVPRDLHLRREGRGAHRRVGADGSA